MPKTTFKAVRVNAVEGKPNADRERIKIYTAEVPASVLAQFTVEQALDVEGGFQRPLDMSRARKIGRLMGGDKKKDEDPRPNVHNGLLAYAYPDEVQWAPRSGILTIKKPLHFIDGQHRGAGAQFAVGFGKVDDYTEGVRIVLNTSGAERATWFSRINLEARKVSPGTTLLDVAQMEGVFARRKSWIARETMGLATDAPFVSETGKRLISWRTRDGGVIKAYSMYKAVNFVLTPELNQEGSEIEAEAEAYARHAFGVFAGLYADWGKVDDKDNLVKAQCYEFTLMCAFAQLYAAVQRSHKRAKAETIDQIVRDAWLKANLHEGLPEGTGSGERAASALASYVAGVAQLGITVEVAAA